MARLDKLVQERGLAASRERAASLVLAGRILVNEQKITKAGTAVPDDAVLRLLGEDLPFVSRGGLKLQGALRTWKIDLKGRLCADIGASTGGFTDCMLQAGAAGVVAVDTGYGQMAHSLRVDARVHLLERTNARLLSPADLLEAAGKLPAVPDDGLTFFSMDVSFISATLVLPAVLQSMAVAGAHWCGEGVVLVKPQFEAGREWVGKGGIVRAPEAHALAVERVQNAVHTLGGSIEGVEESPIKGAEGNREFLLHCRFATRR